jgi:N-acetylglucosaminyl-diphospho-decaprenol L-rhamnosyltransferase
MQAGAIRGDTAGRPCTVSVVSHGQGTLVERLLTDLMAMSSPSIDQVIVTRNLPNDRIRLPDRLPFPVRFIDNPTRRGFGANHNGALACCASPWFAVLNPDLRLREDPFGPMLAEARTDTALLCPLVLEADGREADAARELPTPRRLLRRALERHGIRKASPGENRPSAEWFAGMFMLLRSQALRDVGGFDERYFMYCEDVDLCARLRLSGWKLQQVRGASVVHEAQRASRRSARHLRWHLASLARLWTSPVFSRYRALLEAERRADPAHRMAQG